MKLIIIITCIFCTVSSLAQEKETGPQPMIYHSLVYHQKANKVLLFGGNSRHGWGPDRSEVWQYDPKDQRWTELGNYAAISDSGVNAHAPAYDSESDRIIVFNSVGETWAFELDNLNWENMEPTVAPSPRCGQSMVYDAASDRMVLFGGFGCTSIEDPILNDTWTYDYNANKWEKMNPAVSPPPRMYAAMVYNTNDAKSILWGGRLMGSLDDPSFWTYAVTENTWSEISGTGGPDNTYAYPGMVHDPERNELTLFGGGILTDAFVGTVTDDLWRFNLNTSTWSQISATDGPPPVYLHSMVMHPQTREILLLGGELEKMYSNILLSGTWKLELEDYKWSKNKDLKATNKH